MDSDFLGSSLQIPHRNAPKPERGNYVEGRISPTIHLSYLRWGTDPSNNRNTWRMRNLLSPEVPRPAKQLPELRQTFRAQLGARSWWLLKLFSKRFWRPSLCALVLRLGGPVRFGHSSRYYSRRSTQDQTALEKPLMWNGLAVL